MSEKYSDIHRDIVEESKAGSLKAQYKLYHLYSRAMFNISYRIMNNREDAEDMLQESFSEAFSKLDKFRFESSFGAWLKKIVVNKCINELNRKKIDLNFDDEFIKYEVAQEEQENEESINYEVDKIKKGMQLLPDGFRVIFSLYLLEGYDHNEISEILNISKSTSKTQYMRAKQKLKSILKTVNSEQ